MVPTLRLKSHTMIFAPCLKLKVRWRIVKIITANSGKRAGNIKKLSETFPSVKSKNARCAPHPGHSLPNNCLK